MGGPDQIEYARTLAAGGPPKQDNEFTPSPDLEGAQGARPATREGIVSAVWIAQGHGVNNRLQRRTNAQGPFRDGFLDRHGRKWHPERTGRERFPIWQAVAIPQGPWRSRLSRMLPSPHQIPPTPTW